MRRFSLTDFPAVIAEKCAIQERNNSLDLRSPVPLRKQSAFLRFREPGESGSWISSPSTARYRKRRYQRPGKHDSGKVRNRTFYSLSFGRAVCRLTVSSFYNRVCGLCVRIVKDIPVYTFVGDVSTAGNVAKSSECARVSVSRARTRIETFARSLAENSLSCRK